MRKFVFVILLGLIVFIQTAQAAPVLNVVLSSQTPYPVEPGEIVSIEVEIQNIGYEEARNVVVEINAEAPFSLITGEEPVKTFSRIEAQGSVKTTYRLFVDPETESGDYNIEFLRYSQGETAKASKEISISVRGNPNLVLDSLETTPSKIEPGDSVEIRAVINNVGTGSANYVGTVLNSTSSYIIPELAGGEYYVGSIGAGESKEAVFLMTVDNLAEYQTYLSTLTINYEDETGAEMSKVFSVGIPVRGSPVIEILSSQIDSGDLKVDIENIGTADAKALRINLVQNEDTKDTAIANELKPSKHKTIRFNGFNYGAAQISITYLDETNTEHTDVTDINIKQSVVQEEGGSSELEAFVGLFLIIIVLETFYIWRMRKKHKK